MLVINCVLRIESLPNTNCDGVKADWNYIRSRKQKITKQNNRRENAKRLPHQYREGDQVLLTKESKSKYGHASYEGPYTIVQVNDNGTVRVQKGAVIDTFNIRLIKPYRTYISKQNKNKNKNKCLLHSSIMGENAIYRCIDL